MVLGRVAAAVWVLVVDAPCAYAFTVGAPLPGRVGRDNEILVDGAVPGAAIRVVAGEAGSHTFGACPQLVVAVERRWVSGPVVADAQGLARIDLYAPPSLEGRRVGFQAIDVDACAASPPTWYRWPRAIQRPLDSADAVFIGETDDDYAGTSVSGAGDVNGDGIGDLVIGAERARTRPGISADGMAYVVFGPSSGDVDLGNADARLIGDLIPGMAGHSVAGAGDVDGNGFDDVLVGAPLASPYNDYRGMAFLIHGPVQGDVDLTTSDARLLGNGYRDEAGTSVAGAGDVDGDGFDDVIVGAMRYSSMSGAAYVVRGPVSGNLELRNADAHLYGETASSYAGSSTSGAGDTDGDGFDDILIAAVGYQGGPADGVAYLVRGPMSGSRILSTADARLFGVDASYEHHTIVSGGKDVDLDGYDDILVGSPRPYDGGEAFYVRGPVSGDVDLAASADAILVGGPQQAAGTSVSLAADVNGDAFDDIVVLTGYPGPSSIAWLVLGPASGTIDLAHADGEIAGGAFGVVAVSGTGDVSGDGLGDLLLGVPGYPRGGIWAGAAFLMLGQTF